MLLIAVFAQIASQRGKNSEQRTGVSCRWTVLFDLPSCSAGGSSPGGTPPPPLLLFTFSPPLQAKRLIEVLHEPFLQVPKREEERGPQGSMAVPAVGPATMSPT